MVKITKQGDDPRFIKFLPAGLTGQCQVCRCEVETEGDDPNDEQVGRWYRIEDEGQGRTVDGWQVRCPTEGCGNWIWVSSWR